MCFNVYFTSPGKVTSTPGNICLMEITGGIVPKKKINRKGTQTHVHKVNFNLVSLCCLFQFGMTTNDN